MLLVNIGWASENPASLFAVKMTEFWACASIRRVCSRVKKPRRVTTAQINTSSGLGTKYRMAYYKAHYPQAFYQIYFMSDNKFSDIDVITAGQEAVQKRIKEFLRIGGMEEERIEKLQLVLEMYMRGYSLEIS